MKERRGEIKKEFLKKSLLIGFCVMIATIFLSLFVNYLPEWLAIVLGIISYLALPWTFIFSIINLVKFERKTFAIVALVITSLIILIVAFSFGLIMGYAAAKAGVTF